MTEEEQKKYYELRWKRREETFKFILLFTGTTIGTILLNKGLRKVIK